MKTLKTIGLLALASNMTLGTGCASKPQGNAMVLAAPKLLDVAVSASIVGNHEQAETAFLMAAKASDESPAEVAEAWRNAIEKRIPSLSGESGMDDIATACATGELLCRGLAQDASISHDIRTEAMTKVSQTLRALKSQADALAEAATDTARQVADNGDYFFQPNDREKIHDALVELAPFSVHARLLSRTAAADVMKTKAYVLSYVSTEEHRQLLIDAGHIALEN